MRRHLAAVSADRLHLWALLSITFSTGLIDAVGFLGLDRVFVGNMTGNVVILGMGVAGADDLPVIGPLLALLGFLVGAAASGRILRGCSRRWSNRVTALFATVGGGTLILGGLLFIVEYEARSVAALLLTTLLGTLMGLQAATARFLAVADVTTVVVTSTITGLAADSRFGNGKRGHTGRRLGSILAILFGASAGALLLQVHLASAVLVAGAVVLLATVVCWLHSRIAV